MNLKPLENISCDSCLKPFTDINQIYRTVYTKHRQCQFLCLYCKREEIIEIVQRDLHLFAPNEGLGLEYMSDKFCSVYLNGEKFDKATYVHTGENGTVMRYLRTDSDKLCLIGVTDKLVNLNAISLSADRTPVQEIFHGKVEMVFADSVYEFCGLPIPEKPVSQQMSFQDLTEPLNIKKIKFREFF